MVEYPQARVLRPPERVQRRPSVPAGASRVNAQDILGGAREVILVHNESEYRLRITSNDKLILTK